MKRKRRWAYIACGLAALCAVSTWPLGRLAAELMKDQARHALAARDVGRALVWLGRAERWFASDGETAFLRARAYRKQGNWDSVRSHLNKARALGYSPSRIEREECLAQAQGGQLREVEARLPGLLVDPQEDGAEICEAFVNGYFLNHRLSEAARLVDAWIADFPLDPEPRYVRGKIRSDAQFTKDAEQDFRAALSLDPAYWPAAIELADTLVFEREFAAALDIYRRLAKVLAFGVRARVGEAKCLRLLDRRGEARECVQRLLADVPDSREGHWELGLVDLDDDRFAEAAVSLKQALALNPRALAVRQALSQALRRTGDVEGAKEHAAYVAEAQSALQRADKLCDRVADEPDNADLRYEIGKVYLQYAVPERGLNWIKSALNCDPQHRGAQQALAEFYAQHSTPESAHPGGPPQP